ncbi:CRISPR-associated exonuclease, Cas4 family [Methanobrevibacter olleyae]|uniref:CRISPR-associated exonuclease Cas4 n=1 Tax=Methanobrevibacter olleyae TaxID=294671 RepID=A0A1I4K7E1_METOL|nr:CRISPR-associated protein Cas4 [Methanobrevibacter olleyae]SFL74521.1 CRISPR-associated exonuclease, Cas4 family [Methanobrevibacter olleyae]
MIQYYVTCKRELWFFANQINMNYNNNDIDIGRFIHEKSYSRENKEIQFDNMVFDYVRNKNNLTIFEVKKSSSLTIGARYQLYFYLYNMRNCGKKLKGVLVYPKERKREEIILNDEIIEEMDNIIKGIEHIVNLNIPPKAIKKPYCKGCSFFELCMV